jgi:hypothetical protein
MRKLSRTERIEKIVIEDLYEIIKIHDNLYAPDKYDNEKLENRRAMVRMLKFYCMPEEYEKLMIVEI